MEEQKKIKLNGEDWYIDRKILKAVKVDNPQETLSLNEFSVLLVIEAASSEKKSEKEEDDGTRNDK